MDWADRIETSWKSISARLSRPLYHFARHLAAALSFRQWARTHITRRRYAGTIALEPRADQPIDLEQEDAFDHRDYASAAAEALIRAPVPYTLGIFGDWGVGKTTIIRNLGTRVRQRGLAYVEFDAWRSEHNAVRREFLRAVAEQLQASGQIPHRFDVERELRDLDADTPIAEERIRLSLRYLAVAALGALVVGLAAGLVIWTGLIDTVWGDRPSNAPPTAVLSLGVAAAAFLFGVITNLFRVEQRVVTLRRVEDPGRFAKRFGTLVSQASAERMVIAIDNLDRCSPAVVDELLAMIKTYLEPAVLSVDGRSPEVVYVIAVDDDAIRRHLLARELDGSPASSDENNLTVGKRQVDEYLRKFFSASIRVRPILAEDIGAYARQQLEPIIVWWTENDPGMAVQRDVVETRLVAMVSTALRRNPRRIKQFALSLQARLLTIAAREQSEKIAPRISDDLLGIAKLAILEEEWRDHYRMIEDNPRLVGQWQTQVIDSDLHGAPAELSAFLRDTRDVVPKNVSAVVNLKLERDELELPGFADFRDAVIAADRRAAMLVLDRAPEEERPLYSLKLPELLRGELRARRLIEARNVFDAILQDPPLGLETGEPTRAAASDAVNDPTMVVQLAQLSPDRVFRALALLPPSEQRKGRSPFLELAELAQSRGLAAIVEVAECLASVVGDLSEDERRRITQVLVVDPAATQLRPYVLSLVASDPTLLTEGGIQALINSAAQELDPASAEFEVVTLGMSAGFGLESVGRMITSLQMTVANSLETQQGGEGAIEAVHRFLVRVTSVGDSEELIQLLDTITQNTRSFIYGRHSVRQMIEIADRAYEVNIEAQVHAAAEGLVRKLAAEDWADAAEAIEPVEPLGAGVRRALGDAFLQVLATRPEPATENGLVQAVLAVHPEGASQLASFLAELAATGRLPEAEALVRLQTEALVEPVATELSGRIASDPSNRPAYITAFLRLGDRLPPESLATLGGVLAQAYVADPNTIEPLLESEAEPFVTKSRALFAHAIVETLEALDGFSEDSLPAARLVIGSWPDLSANTRRRIQALLVDWVDEAPDYAPEISALLEGFQGGSSYRTPLIRALLRAGAAAGQATWRMQALAGANDLAHDDPRLRTLIRKRLESLMKRDDPLTQEALRLLEEGTDSPSE